MDLILDSILEDAFDDIVDDAIEDSEVESTDDEEQMYEVPVDTPEEYSDPYIMYSDDEDEGENDYEDGSTYEVGATDDDNDLDTVIADLDARIAGEDAEEDEEDIFVQESASMKGDNFFTLEDTNAILDDLDTYLSESYFLNNTITFDNKLFTEAAEGKMSFFEKIKRAIEWLWEQIQRAYKTIKTKIINILNGNTGFLKKIKDFPKFVKSKNNKNESALYVTESKKGSGNQQNSGDNKSEPKKPDITYMSDDEIKRKSEELEAERKRRQEEQERKAEEERQRDEEKQRTWQQQYEKEQEKINRINNERNKTLNKLKKSGKTAERKLAEETTLMWTFVEDNFRRKAVLDKLYNNKVTILDIDKLAEEEDDIKEASRMARTAKFFEIKDLGDDETLINYMEKITKDRYFARGLPKPVNYVDLISRIDIVCKQFEELYRFSSKIYVNLEMELSKTQKHYNILLKHYEKVFKDFVNGKAYDKSYKDEDDLGYSGNHLTNSVVSKWDKQNPVNNSHNVAEVHHRLEILQTVCGNHINLIRAHIRVLTECTSTEFRFTKHAIDVMMITEGYKDKKSPSVV